MHDPTNLTAHSPAQIVVCQDDPHCWQTIGDALRNAPAGARIIVRPGNYHEQLIISKPVEIVGDGPRSEIVLENSTESCLLLQSDNVSICGMVIKGLGNPSGQPFYTVTITQGSPILEGCTITSESLGCVSIQGTQTQPLIRRCLIHDSPGSGLSFSNQASGLIDSCKISGNAQGIVIGPQSNPTIRHCEIYDVITNQGQALIEDCQFYTAIPSTANKKHSQIEFEMKMSAGLLAGFGTILGGSLSLLISEVLPGINDVLHSALVGALVGGSFLGHALWHTTRVSIGRMLVAGAVIGGFLGSLIGEQWLLAGIIFGAAGLLIIAVRDALQLQDALIVPGIGVGVLFGGLLGLLGEIFLWFAPLIFRATIASAVIGALFGAIYGWLDFGPRRRI